MKSLRCEGVETGCKDCFAWILTCALLGRYLRRRRSADGDCAERRNAALGGRAGGPAARGRWSRCLARSVTSRARWCRSGTCGSALLRDLLCTSLDAQANAQFLNPEGMGVRCRATRRMARSTRARNWTPRRARRSPRRSNRRCCRSASRKLEAFAQTAAAAVEARGEAGPYLSGASLTIADLELFGIVGTPRWQLLRRCGRGVAHGM